MRVRGSALALAVVAVLVGGCASHAPAVGTPPARTGAATTVAATPTPTPLPTVTPSASCAVGPLRTPTGGRRWWSTDLHCYSSPWFAGRHQIMIGFGCTPAPYYPHDARCPGTEGFHHGIDIDMPAGTPVYAAVAGVVVSTRADGSAYGTRPVKIRSGGSDILLGHLERTYVSVGQSVHPGQLIGLAGQSGAPDGPHLHFEVRPAGEDYRSAVDPWSRLGMRVTGRN